MCSPLDPLSCADAISRGIQGKATEVVTNLVTNNLTTLLSGLTDQLHVGIKFLSVMLAGWILVPSTQVCPDSGPGWVAACASGTSPAAQVRSWMLPITALVAVVGILWQGITMAITRKSEPLLIVLKGLFTTAVWGVVGIAGTQLALRAGDSYSYWILRQAIFGDSMHPTQDLGDAIANMSAGESYTAVLVLILLQIPFFLVTVTQIILMIFREGAVIVLAGQLQLAAAGGFTKLTSGWLTKVTGWMLALIAYKPVAASIYAVAFALMGDGIRNLVMGLAVMLLALIAMPTLMKFFNWTVGAIGNGNANTLGMLGTSLAAGMHGASAMRGLGGHGATEHARWMDTHGPGAPGGGGGSDGGAPGRPDSPPPPPPPPTSTASAPGGATTTASTGGATASGATAAGGASASAAAGAASGGATLAADAAVQAARQVKQHVERAAGTVGDAMQGK
ncbi:MAG: hypothetical protein QOE61_2405 [Micromonosporaceae bacterium]|nr:hypothetical protein [Micromonosporaceae bacterium]